MYYRGGSSPAIFVEFAVDLKLVGDCARIHGPNLDSAFSSVSFLLGGFGHVDSVCYSFSHL